MNEPIIFFDTETTGVDIAKDRIIQISGKIIHGFDTIAVIDETINPGISISEEAIKVHGITNEMVADKPSFADIATKIYDFFQQAKIIAGFNIDRFDIPLLIEHFLREGLECEFEDKIIIDLIKIFHKKEERTLSAAMKFYCNKDHENAHNSLADVDASIDIYWAMIRKYEDLPTDSKELSEWCFDGKKKVDPAGKFGINDKGQIIFNFSKHKDTPVTEERGMLEWMLKMDFPLSTKYQVRKILKSMDENKVKKFE